MCQALPSNFGTKSNIELIKLIFKELSINKRFEIASQIGVEGKSTSLLIDICRKLNVTSYLSGKGGAKYQEEEEFKKANIKLIQILFIHFTPNSGVNL